MKKDNLPIGYWIKRADQLLTQRIDEAQRSNDLTRLEWQILNVIQEQGTALHDAVAEAVRPFADTKAVENVLDRLAQRALVEKLDTSYKLTGSGSALYAHALSLQKAVRQRATVGISEADYATTLRVLQQLVENLEREDAA